MYLYPRGKQRNESRSRRRNPVYTFYRRTFAKSTRQQHGSSTVSNSLRKFIGRCTASLWQLLMSFSFSAHPQLEKVKCSARTEVFSSLSRARTHTHAIRAFTIYICHPAFAHTLIPAVKACRINFQSDDDDCLARPALLSLCTRLNRISAGRASGVKSSFD